MFDGIVIVAQVVRYGGGGISEVRWVCEVEVIGEISDDAGIKGPVVRIVCGGVFEFLRRELYVRGM